jgi:hypothetical protein
MTLVFKKEYLAVDGVKTMFGVYLPTCAIFSYVACTPFYGLVIDQWPISIIIVERYGIHLVFNGSSPSSVLFGHPLPAIVLANLPFYIGGDFYYFKISKVPVGG